MKRLIIVAAVLLSGCAGLEHHRIATENAAKEKAMGIPTYGVSNRNHPLTDFLHGQAWWYGADAAKKELDKAIRN